MKKLMKMGIVGLAAAAAMATAVVAQPAPPTPEQQAERAVSTRQALFDLLGWNMDPLGGMLRGNVEFNAATVQANATNIAGLAPMIPDLFANDTREFDVETKAQDSIWTSKADFDMKAAALHDAAVAASEAAASGDAAATRQAIGRIGQACGSCHDAFRLD